MFRSIPCNQSLPSRGLRNGTNSAAHTDHGSYLTKILANTGRRRSLQTDHRALKESVQCRKYVYPHRCLDDIPHKQKHTCHKCTWCQDVERTDIIGVEPRKDSARERRAVDDCQKPECFSFFDSELGRERLDIPKWGEHSYLSDRCACIEGFTKQDKEESNGKEGEGRIFKVFEV